MELLAVHIVVGIASLAAGAGAVLLARRAWLRVQVGLFALTTLSGILLAFATPQALGRICVSAVLFSSVTLVLSLTARRRMMANAALAYLDKKAYNDDRLSIKQNSSPEMRKWSKDYGSRTLG